MNQNFTNEIRFPSTRTLPVPVSLLPLPDPRVAVLYLKVTSQGKLMIFYNLILFLIF